MMEHTKQFDWCYSTPDRYFIDEKDLDKSNTEKILNNRFYDPLAFSDTEEEVTPNNIDWDEIFKLTKNPKPNRVFTPGLRHPPPYPKQSSFTSNQHYQFLKVICAEFPNVLPGLFHPTPHKKDIKAFQVVKEDYLKEQKEFTDWAKTLWHTDHCIRALRPKPAIETVYEAEFKVRAQRLKGYPKNYAMAAQIPLEGKNGDCEAVLMEELLTVHPTDLPQIEIPEEITQQFTVIRPCDVPEPCNKHPYQFILPHDDDVSMLPIVEIHRELAHYAAEHGTQFIASENALRCLMELERSWTLALSVCDTITPDGDVCNVVVLDSEFSLRKESAPLRTFRALKHLLEYALLPSSEREKMLQKNNKSPRRTTSSNSEQDDDLIQMKDLEMSSDEEDNSLFIDTDEIDDIDRPMTMSPSHMQSNGHAKKRTARNSSDTHTALSGANNFNITDTMDVGTYSCSCKDSLWERPPPRSFKRWQIRNSTTKQNQDIIVHCAHKYRVGSEETLVEPIPEYQLDLGASQQKADRLRSLALSLMLRQKAAVLNVRVDGASGDVVTFDRITSEQFMEQNPDLKTTAANTLYCALNQLQGLMPGHYLLQHESSHGANALLFVARNNAQMKLEFDSSQVDDTEELKCVKTPPILVPILLPFHKSRKMLPCTFTPYANQVAKDTKKLPAKQKAPPQAIKLQAESADGANRKWPKKKNNKRKLAK